MWLAIIQFIESEIEQKGGGRTYLFSLLELRHPSSPTLTHLESLDYRAYPNSLSGSLAFWLRLRIIPLVSMDPRQLDSE
jgi:hypothetical protein